MLEERTSDMYDLRKPNQLGNILYPSLNLSTAIEPVLISELMLEKQHNYRGTTNVAKRESSVSCQVG